jgi:hypothetical protein
VLDGRLLGVVVVHSVGIPGYFFAGWLFRENFGALGEFTQLS